MSDSTPGIMDLSDKGPDCREWQALKRYVREYASQIVREIMASENAPSAPPQDTGKGNLKTQRECERERELIRQALERYRIEPPDSNIRKGIDWLLQRHARWERFMQSDPLFRKRHNALVLEYIISRPMTRTAIEKRLGISDNGYKNQLEKGISELAQILFWHRE
ncbi:hypothetical protein D7V86_25150 [bacterium D16-51]|nr:hypothetical protein D7V96_25820 [bacterium D16-59]RKI53334.1 hypothetical protein D7V86_25150 [bacterium D16-51]